VRLTLDTNVLVRAIVADDEEQVESARRVLAETDEIILTLPALCELAWVLRTYYRTPDAQIASAIRGLVAADNTVLDEAAVLIGLGVVDAGGDFADGVIAASGVAMGADAFVSFDKKAVRLISDTGLSTRLL
jgi:predicted nucleic-acid-binding protein